MDTGTDDCFAMRPWSASRGRSINDSVTVTVELVFEVKVTVKYSKVSKVYGYS